VRCVSSEGSEGLLRYCRPKKTAFKQVVVNDVVVVLDKLSNRSSKSLNGQTLARLIHHYLLQLVV